MAGKTKKRRADKNRQKKQNKRKQRNTTTSPSSHLSANGLRRLVRAVNMEECGLVQGFKESVSELDRRLREYLERPWQGESSLAYPDMLNLRAELEESMLSEEQVSSLMKALEKEATARRAYGALMAGLERDSFIDVLWREVFSMLSEGVDDPTLRLRARLFLADYAPEDRSETVDLELFTREFALPVDRLEQLQGRLLMHPALLRFAEFYPHLQARARQAGLNPLLTTDEADQAAVKLNLGWAQSMVESSLGRRIAQLFELEGIEIAAALTTLGAAMAGGDPLDMGSWSELQLDPDSVRIRLGLASQQLAETPDESVALLEGIEVEPELSLHADEVLTTAYLATGQSESLRRRAEAALGRVAAGQLPEGLDPNIPGAFFQRFLNWLEPRKVIDWKAATEGVPTIEGVQGPAHFQQSLESGFRFAWETAIRAEQGLALSDFQEGYLKALPSEDGRLEFIDGMPRPTSPWEDELNSYLRQALKNEDWLEALVKPDSPYNWRGLCALVRERALELDNRGGHPEPLAAIDQGLRFELDRRWCLQQYEEQGPAALLGSMIQLRSSLISSASSLDEFLAPHGDSSSELRESLKSWLNLKDGTDLAARLALFNIA